MSNCLEKFSRYLSPDRTYNTVFGFQFSVFGEKNKKNRVLES